MRTLASICLALLLAVTLGWSAPLSAAASEAPAPAASPCAEMDMGGTPMPGKSPSPHKKTMGCAVSCSVGCAVPPRQELSAIGEPVAWGRAFGRPAAARKLVSATPEAEDPPPRTYHI